MQSGQPTSRLTAIFSKQPRAGEVKTRLSPPLTVDEAADLALAILDDTVAKCCACRAFETALVIAPPQSLAWFRRRYRQVRRVEPQTGSSLGERMQAFFQSELTQRPGQSTVVIGSDAPLLPLGTIVSAHQALESGAELVLAPDQGGGYALIGLARCVPELFTGVPMSTRDMCARTIDLARAGGLRLELLAPCYDIDLPADLERLRSELAGHAASVAEQAPRTAQWLREQAGRGP